ncbi:MAG TPA: C40 family peptidase [Aquimonas sp.]|jgi:cell wall-associated NlpC family hydrolase|nr:C40 family peptidase [Xanthomonadales bacterium]HRD72500.1 C40 family peptidase [Aquimonas sp.]HRF53138.1 C40 family peptidase [Aquimonas sp.]
MWQPNCNHLRGIGGALALALLVACASRPAVIEPPPAAPGRVPDRAPSSTSWPGNEAMFMALSLVGTPYRYGGNTPESGFDCSGLIGYVFRTSLSLVLPRTTGALFQAAGEQIAPSELRTGDLVFFGSRRDVSHAGIYVGESRFVHAPSSGGTVRLDHLDSAYWKARFLGARRVLR